MPARVPVTAVLVAHDGSRWLPEALTALHAQTVTPARLVAVDTGSSDDSVDLLRRTSGQVLELPRGAGFPDAVSFALAAVPSDTRWVWLLHDDCAPDPDALSQLLRAAAADPSAALLGPKVVDWRNPRVLLEIGLTTDGSGVLDPGVEPDELDQGQHDEPRDVLAVGTAGLLVRRDAWDALGGLDPDLPVFRDGLDLGWRANAAGHRVLVVPSARVRHVRAATTGRRRIDAAPGRPHAVDRRAALHVLLAHAAGWRLATALPRLAVACLLRALALLLVRRPQAAVDELSALLHVLARPAPLVAARRGRRATRTVPRRSLQPLMSSPWVRAQTRLSAVLDRRRDRGIPTLDEPSAPPGRKDRLRRSPVLLLALALGVVTLLAVRSLLGRGVLVGGQLVPAPETVGQVWQTYRDHGEPALALLGLLGTALLGRAGLAVDLLLLGLVPLSGLVAYVVAGRVVRSPALRMWAGATWALLPVATGAVAAGRLDAAAAHLALPPLLLAGYDLTRTDPRSAGWSRAWAVGLALTATAAVAPLLWLLVATLLVGTALLRSAATAPALRPAARRRGLGCLLAAALPALLLLPWSPALLDPSRIVHGPGSRAPGLAEAALPSWDLLLLQPGGPGTPPLLVTLGLVLAAVAGLLRTRRAPVAAAGWALALVGLAVAVLLARVSVDGTPVWPGLPLDLAALGMLLAALVGAEGLQHSLVRSSFGSRQLAAVLVVVAAAVVPLAAAATWVGRGADGPLDRADRDLLPAHAHAELAQTPGLHALLLTERADASVGYALAGSRGPLLGERTREIDAPVAALLAPPTPDAAARLASRGVGFVALSAQENGVAARALDAQPGLSRLPSAPALWRVEPAATPAVPGEADRLLPLPLQAVAVLVVAVLAGPGSRPRRGLVPEPRR